MHFVSCDWGSSTFRLRLADTKSSETDAGISLAEGCATLARGADSAEQRAARFAAVLEEGLRKLDRRARSVEVPVILSGMVTSAHGWIDLPYAVAPVSATAAGLLSALRRQADGRRLIFVSGIRTEKDVMRGEECQLAGLLAWARAERCLPPETYTVLLPGTHCKHVTMQGDRVVDFRTFMTGELYAILRDHSVLRHSMPAGEGAPPDLDSAAVADGARLVAERGLAEALFQVRAGMLLRDDAPRRSQGLLNGILVGAEFAGLPDLRDARPMLLCAAGRLGRIYRTVMHALGLGSALHVVPDSVVDRLAVFGHAAVLGQLIQGEDVL